MRPLLTILTLAAACGGADKPYYLPVDSPARPFSPPEADELVDADGAWDDCECDGAGDGDGDGDADAADPRQALTMTLVQSRRAFENCYTRALERAPTLRGRVELRVVVGVDGKPTEASAAGLPGVAPCVAQVARGLVFPRPAGGEAVSVDYPFVFSPK